MEKDKIARLMTAIGTAALCLGMMTACSTGQSSQTGGENMKIKFSMPKIKTETNLSYKDTFRQEMSDIELSEVTSLEAYVSVGSLSVSASADEQMHVTAVYTVRATSQADLDQIVSAVNTVYLLEEDLVQISVENSETGENIWDWLDRTFSAYSLSADLTIQIPETLANCCLTSETGDLEAEGIRGTIKASTETGDVSIRDVVFEGDSALTTETGDVIVRLCEDVGSVSNITMSAETGDVTLDCGSLEAVNRSSARNEISVCVEETYSVTLSTETGDIRIQ